MAYNKAEKTDSSMKRRAPRRRKKVCVFCGENNDRSYQESSSYRTYAIYSRVIGYKNKKSGVRTRLLKGAHESALLFSCWIVFIFGITAITM